MEPEILNTKGKSETLALCAAYECDPQGYDAGKQAFNFDSDIYGHTTVKTTLEEMQHGKCCFCESKIKHIGFGDVEHYRPKAGYKQTTKDKLQKPGYYWLAYSWNNLLFCCERCNRHYKKNHFPLLKSTARARHHGDDIALETPLLINPTLTNPQAHIGFRDEVPYAISRYGKTTITVLSLDREDLNERRRTKLAELKVLLDVISVAKRQPNNQELQYLSEEAQRVLSEAILPTAEYSAMTRKLNLDLAF